MQETHNKSTLCLSTIAHGFISLYCDKLQLSNPDGWTDLNNTLLKHYVFNMVSSIHQISVFSWSYFETSHFIYNSYVAFMENIYLFSQQCMYEWIYEWSFHVYYCTPKALYNHIRESPQHQSEHINTLLCLCCHIM